MKISAFASLRKSMIDRSCNPRSMFQSTTRMELRGQDSHWFGAKLSAIISLVDMIKQLSPQHLEFLRRDSEIHSAVQKSGPRDHRSRPRAIRPCLYNQRELLRRRA